jgi:hypothetical protein
MYPLAAARKVKNTEIGVPFIRSDIVGDGLGVEFPSVVCHTTPPQGTAFIDIAHYFLHPGPSPTTSDNKKA